jgi:hypothetical protein
VNPTRTSLICSRASAATLLTQRNVETLDELVNACDVLRRMAAEGVSVADAVASCHASPRPDAAVAAGLHLLTGHKAEAAFQTRRQLRTDSMGKGFAASP